MPRRYLRFTFSLLLPCLILFTLSFPSQLHATLPFTGPNDSLWGSDMGFLSPQAARQLRLLSPVPERDLREILGHFQQTCTFLDSMQEHDRESDVFGGLHEGEGDQLWAIVETDNTQEAIRVWCEYASWFDDEDRFRNNVEDAWTYCDSFPAWEESEPNEFYAMHNAGWGLVAVMGYRQVYGNGRDEYGRLCAEHLIDNVPEITPNMQDNLMPLVAGWCAGTLYEYGLATQNESYRNEAFRIAGQVKNWIESNPARLNRNEIWALCGGTAMWGVIRTFAREDSTSDEWIPDLLEEMDVLAGAGNWNNSWNIWYAHAWLSAYEFYNDEEYLRNAGTIIDALLEQDTDDDGGIPATIGDANNRDQAWVSAYTAWMGLRNMFEGIPEVDISLLRLLSPLNNRPWPVGSELTFLLRIQQNGSTEFLENVPIQITGSWESNQTFDIQGWEPRAIQLESSWTPVEPGIANFTFISNNENDADRSNDTLQYQLDIRPFSDVAVSILDTLGNEIGGSVVISSLEFPATLPPVEIAIANGESGSVRMMRGYYSAHIHPDFPYADEELDSVFITGSDRDQIIFGVVHPPVLIVENDTDTSNFGYIKSSFGDLDIKYRRWQVSVDGSFTNRTTGFNTILFFTGDRTDSILSVENQQEIGAALDNGVSILISGQNIAEDLDGTDFLEERLHTRLLTGNIRSRQVEGQAGDELMDGMRLLLLGNQGAGNQSSTDGIYPVNGGITAAVYTDRGDTAAVVRWTEESGARGIFCGFGIEAISGAGGTTNRSRFLEQALSWLGVPLDITNEERHSIPEKSGIITAYPNPFNSGVRLGFEHPSTRKANLFVWDLNGRLVKVLPPEAGGTYYWDGSIHSGQSVISGSYFVTTDAVFSSSLPPALRIILVR